MLARMDDEILVAGHPINESEWQRAPLWPAIRAGVVTLVGEAAILAATWGVQAAGWIKQPTSMPDNAVLAAIGLFIPAAVFGLGYFFFTIPGTLRDQRNEARRALGSDMGTPEQQAIDELETLPLPNGMNGADYLLRYRGRFAERIPCGLQLGAKTPEEEALVHEWWKRLANLGLIRDSSGYAELTEKGQRVCDRIADMAKRPVKRLVSNP
jgi:hypothetical protein